MFHVGSQVKKKKFIIPGQTKLPRGFQMEQKGTLVRAEINPEPLKPFPTKN